MAQATLYTPHPKQREIHNSINNESYKYYTLAIGRQWGKTMLATNQMIYWALNNKNVRIGWVSPIFRQSKKVFKETYKTFAKRPEIYGSATSHSDLIIEYRTGSTIQFFSAENYDNIRGNTFDYLICDEFAFINKRAWDEVLRATVLVRGKKVLLISTPKGKNHFWHIYNLANQNVLYKSFNLSSYENPIISKSEIDDARSTLPEHVFRQEYLAEFVDGGSGLFLNPITIVAAIRTNRMYAGLDIGRADDYTVLSVFNENGEMHYIERWNHSSWSSIVDKVVNRINEFECHTFVEVNGIGDPIFEQIQNKVNDSNLIQPFVTTSKSKQDIIEQLVVANQSKEIKFLECEWFLKELDLFTYEYNPKTKSVRYSAPSGFHDDGVMATAIGYNALKKLKMQGVYHYG